MTKNMTLSLDIAMVLIQFAHRRTSLGRGDISRDASLSLEEEKNKELTNVTHQFPSSTRPHRHFQGTSLTARAVCVGK
jgi:hypothetical protein